MDKNEGGILTQGAVGITYFARFVSVSIETRDLIFHIKKQHKNVIVFLPFSSNVAGPNVWCPIAAFSPQTLARLTYFETLRLTIYGKHIFLVWFET